MGYENLAGRPEVWLEYRDEFPVTSELIYLNHAAVAPLSRRAMNAMRDWADDACRLGSLHYDTWLQTFENLRLRTAQLCGAHKSEIAIVKNTSEGIATVALGFPFRSGDRIVAFREEFPANYYIWQKLEAKRVSIQWLSVEDPLERVEAACRGARLLTISFVQYLSGFRADLEAIGAICLRNDVFFFVDAIQGLGAFPMDVESMHIDAFAADGHKWMLGPEGCGVLYVRQEWQDLIEPVEFGWTNVAAYADYASRDMTLRADAGRYECGTLNTIGCFGLCASLDLLLEAGVDRIGPHVQSITDRLADGARSKGYEVLGPRTPSTGAGIIAIRKEGVDARAVNAHLRANRIIAAPRQGWVRMSPHFYVTAEDIDRVVSFLP
jgi:cysteine desulfurase / selenocysteine lyase